MKKIYLFLSKESKWFGSLVLDLLERKLNEHGSEFLCGANYTMADCMYTCMMARLNLVNLLEDQLKTKPKLALWWNRVQARPSFKAAGLFKEPFSYSMAVKKMCTILWKYKGKSKKCKSRSLFSIKGFTSEASRKSQFLLQHTVGDTKSISRYWNIKLSHIYISFNGIVR